MYRGDLFALVLLVIASLVTGAISSPDLVSVHLEAHAAEDKGGELQLRALGGGALRILCLGASIVFGYKSSDGNGFRYALRKKLVEDGQVVNMIGSLTGGNMGDNQVEGWVGYKIAEVGIKAEASLPQLPNVVCIHAGTNDMIQNYNVSHAAERLGAIIDKIFVAVPGVTIIVSTLLPTAASTPAANVLQYNADLVLVVNSRSSAGKRIILVDMHNITDLGVDGVHPTDVGYQKMATIFYNGILSMGAVIQPPGTVAGIDDAAAPNDKGAIVNVEVSCVVTVALTSTKCATSTSKPQTCDPKTSGCPYGATTTVTSTQVSSIIPSTKASSIFVTAKPVVGAVESSSASTTSSGKASLSSSVSQSESSRSKTFMSTTSVMVSQAFTSTSNSIGSSTGTTLIPAVAVTSSVSAGSSTNTVPASTTSKSSANRAGETSFGFWVALVIGMVGWTF